MTQSYADHYVSEWEACSTGMPKYSKTYSHAAKSLKEEKLDQFLKSIQSFRRKKLGKSSRNIDEQAFFRNTRDFFRDGFDFTDGQLDVMFSDTLLEVTKTFVSQARSFDPDLSFQDIFQACRNVWIMNGLQLILGIPIHLTPAIFAYSLLYPYTDNLIDDPLISGFEKSIFSERFRERLSGKEILPGNKTEKAIFCLVEMIENQYYRADFPEVFESLLAIHAAQTNSLKLIQQKDSISEKEILTICITKGGTSVLADGYLVAGKLSTEQKFFLYGYGAYLQLLDDVQDVEEDGKSGLMTVFSNTAFRKPLDQKLNKTWWFGELVLKSLNSFEGQQMGLFKSLMRKSTKLFIVEAIAQNPKAFSPDYVSEFETRSPFHFAYIRKRRENFISYHGFLLTALEEIAFSENSVMAAG